jgi:hypothetical protein
MFESRADAAEGKHFIRVWSKAVFWAVVMIIVAQLLFFATRASRAAAATTL